jgi:hypothetical protein
MADSKSFRQRVAMIGERSGVLGWANKTIVLKTSGNVTHHLETSKQIIEQPVL